jgi:hypothetical protein
VYHGGEIFLEFLRDAEGSDQISHFQSAEVGDEILVHDKVRAFSGIAEGSDENCEFQSELIPDCEGDIRILFVVLLLKCFLIKFCVPWW